MRVGVVVQARMGSSRLPGKVMMPLAGRTVLEHVLRRCAQIDGIDQVICAVPERVESAPLEDVARMCGARVSRGSETDVLARYLAAASENALDAVMRVTSDCPLIDPAICSNLLRLREESAADYACNNMPRTFPHGLDCEAFLVAALRAAAAFSTEAADREHVTPWMRRAGHLRRVNLSSHRAGISHHRWTLDYQEDFAFFEALYSVIPSESEPCMNDVLAVLDSNPEISRINRARSAGETEPAPTSAPGRRS